MVTESKQDNEGVQFVVQRLYVKDLSYETVDSPNIFKEQWQPEINMELNNSTQKLEDDTFEVILKVTLTCKVGEKTAYLIEVQQGGIFLVKGYNNEDIHRILGSHCPGILFPYVREVISDIVAKGSFPQMLLQPIDFNTLYLQHLEQQKTEQESSTNVTH
jgi:preprotein translocase subunit SecB